MTDQKKVREAFEAWAYEQAFDLTRFLNGELYNNPFTQDAWAGWQAALAHASSEAKGGEAVAVDSKALSLMNAKLCTFGMAWHLDGDYLRCRKCRRPQIASCADLPFPHAASCKAEGEVEKHPWRTLIGLLNPLYTSPRATAEDVRDSEVLRSLIAELRQREQVGRKKYGTDLDRTDLSAADLRQHLREELMDALMYSHAFDAALAEGREVGK